MRHRSLLSMPILAAVAAVGFSSVAIAHPGHGGGLAAGLAHPLTGLDHALAMVAVGLWASHLGRPAIWLLPLVFPAMMAAGAALGANGIIVPWVEIGIVASVVALGAAVAFGVRLPLAGSVALVGLFQSSTAMLTVPKSPRPFRRTSTRSGSSRRRWRCMAPASLSAC